MIGSFRQSMTWLHTWAGLVVCWILYFMFVTGTLGYFDSEIDRWMQPEQAPSPQVSFEEAAAVARARLEAEAATSERWVFTPPDGRERPHLQLFANMPKDEETGETNNLNEQIDLATGQPLGEPVRETGGGQVLYRMHYILHYLDTDIAYRLVGLLTMLMFIGMITGIIVHKKIFKDFFTFRLAKGQRSWLDIHNMLSVTSLPFQLMITYSGLIFMVTTWMPLVALGSYGFDTKAAGEVIAEATGNAPLEAAGVPADLVDFAPLIADVRERWGEDNIYRMEVRHPGDANAQVTLYRRESASRVPTRVIYNGVTGEVIDDRTDYVVAPVTVAATFLGLHEGLFAGPVLRWLYFLSGVLGTAMIATGAIHYTAKRRKSSPSEQTRGFRVVECLNIGTIMGLPAAIAVYFLANRLLPLGMEHRAEWEVHSMFIVWALCLLYPILRPARAAWRDLAWFSSATCVAVPVVNLATVHDAHLLATLPAGDWVLAGFDLTLLAFGALFALCAVLIARQGDRVTEGDASPAVDAAPADAVA